MTPSSPSWPVVVELSGWPPGPNERLHPLARYRLSRPFKDAVALQARNLHRGPPLHRAKVTITFVAPSRRSVQDLDNAYSRGKCVLDGLKGVLLLDDAPAHLHLEVTQELGRARGVRIAVWPLDPLAVEDTP